VKTLGLPKTLIGLLRRSIQLRAVVSTVVLSGISLVALGGFLSYSIGNGLFQTRQNQILDESQRAVVQVQSTFSAANVTDEVALQTLMNSVVPNLESNNGNQDRKVALLRSPGQSNTSLVLQSPISSSLNYASITPEFRAKVVKSANNLKYQSISIPTATGNHPGIVVGAPIQIPLAGTYELYLVFDLNSEQETLDFVQRTLVVGGLITLIIIATISFFVINWLVQPVQVASNVAEKIAAGDLDQRLPEKGEDVLANLARSFNRMAASQQKQITKLASVSNMQQRFVSDVSHELRTPMTTIRLSGDLLFDNRDKLAPSLQRPAEILHNQVVRFERLLTDLLELSRYDAGGIQADMEMQDIQGVVGMAIALVEPLANNKGSKINIQLPTELVEVELDGKRIERLLRNLLANAVEHGEGKSIDVHVAANEDAVAISVTDYGVGMNEDQLSRVFDRFWRADPARKRTSGGTGLGLSISQEDALLHNGWLQVWAAPNQGASFRLTLPRDRSKQLSASPLALPPKPLWDRDGRKLPNLPGESALADEPSEATDSPIEPKPSTSEGDA
jgi:two-component system sensor histidine kinase MtrB